jgi:hypothetical protein
MKVSLDFDLDELPYVRSQFATFSSPQFLTFREWPYVIIDDFASSLVSVEIASCARSLRRAVRCSLHVLQMLSFFQRISPEQALAQHTHLCRNHCTGACASEVACSALEAASTPPALSSTSDNF